MASDGEAMPSFVDEASTLGLDGLFTLNPPDSHAPRQEVFVPVHGFVRLSEAERAVLDHPAMQRLRLIRQLGMSHLVYPGATHSRFEHALGTLQMAQIMIEHVQRRHEDSQARGQTGRWVLDQPLTDAECVFVRLAALVHDIAHLPFGHSLEDELGILEKHDEVSRVRDVLGRTSWNGLHGRSLEAVIDLAYRDVAGTVGVASGRATDIVVALIARKVSPPETLGLGLRWSVCRSLVGDTLCADLLDYLHRDFHHLGMPHPLSLRILQYLEIRRPRRSDKYSPEAALVLNLATSDRPRSDAVTDLLALLSRRHELFEIALYHRTKLGATAMLERALVELDNDGKAWADLGEAQEGLYELLLDTGDDSFLDDIRRRASDRLAGADDQLAVSLQTALRLSQALVQRRLHSPVYLRTGAQLPGSAVARIREVFGGKVGRGARLNAARGLEAGFGWPAGSVALYCADEPQFKVALVNVLVDDEVRTLKSHETIVDSGQSSSNLTGGALAAGERRFAQLWRVVVCVERSVWNKGDERTREVFQSALADVLGAGDPAQAARTPTRIGEELADALRRWCPTSPLYGKPELRLDLAGAKRSAEGQTFPTGIPWPTEYLP